LLLPVGRPLGVLVLEVELDEELVPVVELVVELVLEGELPGLMEVVLEVELAALEELEELAPPRGVSTTGTAVKTIGTQPSGITSPKTA